MQTTLAAIFALAAAYFAWRYFNTLRDVRRLTGWIRQSNHPDPGDLDTASGSLAQLSRSVGDLVSEATLTRDLEASRRQFLETLLDQIEDALLIVDEASEVRFSNRAARLQFPSELSQIGRPLIEVCFDHRIVETVALAKKLRAKTQEQFTRRMRTPIDGRAEHTYLIEAEPLSSRGIGDGAWVLIRDVTLQVETERVRQDFVANASHELRTPLSIISGYVEMMEDGMDPATLGRCVPTMRKHTQRLGRLVEDMLTISKLESQEGNLNREPFDFAACLRDTLDHLHPIIEQQHARIHLDLPLEAAMIGDRFYWDQVFFNLIENALKQNPEPGLNITVRLIAESGRYRIDIIDDGIGIPSTDLPHIFKRFYRVQKDHAQTVKGTGLGLSIVKRAVEAHHGTIKVRSRPGSETAFTIEVPQPPATKGLSAGASPTGGESSDRTAT